MENLCREIFIPIKAKVCQLTAFPMKNISERPEHKINCTHNKRQVYDNCYKKKEKKKEDKYMTSYRRQVIQSSNSPLISL